MRVLIVNGSPRKGGYTTDLIDLFRKGAESEGADVSVVSLRTQKIAPCIGCFKCWVGKTAGRCIFSDDMDEILENYLESDVLVLATPMYYYSFSSLMKIFLERLFPTCQPGLDMGGALGLGRNRARYPDKGPKKCALIASCGLHNKKTTHALVSSYELVCDAIAAEPVGKLLRPESNLLDFEHAKPRIMRRVREAFVEGGVELVRDGRISVKTEDEAVLRFTLSEEVFATHFETYWTIASEMGSKWIDRQALADVANKEPRIIVRELAGFFNPKMAGDMKAVIQFNLEDHEHGEWQLIIEDGTCRAVAGVHPGPDLTMSMSKTIFNDIALQRISARQAFQRKKIRTEGSKELLARFIRIFQRPVS
jgi:multimeric flavodoxin WrbA/putative sterol carrier protein